MQPGSVVKDGSLLARDGARYRWKTIGHSDLVVENRMPFDLLYLPSMAM